MAQRCAIVGSGTYVTTRDTTTTFRLRAVNLAGETVVERTVGVAAPRVGTFVGPDVVLPGERPRLQWEVDGADVVELHADGILLARDLPSTGEFEADALESTERTFELEGNEAYELQASWRNPPERNWPAGGPLITRIVTCDNQDRTYLLDAWLYAPGKEKYEYMIQLETLLDSFRCTS